MAEEVQTTVARVASRGGGPGRGGALSGRRESAGRTGHGARSRRSTRSRGTSGRCCRSAAAGPKPDDAVSLTPCLAAIAETGTLMLVSGADTPTTLNFLPDTHIVVAARRPGRRELRGRLGPGCAPGPEDGRRPALAAHGQSHHRPVAHRRYRAAHPARRARPAPSACRAGRGLAAAMMRVSSDDIGLWRRAMRDVSRCAAGLSTPPAALPRCRARQGRRRMPARRRRFGSMARSARSRLDRARHPRCHRPRSTASPGSTAPAPSG